MKAREFRLRKYRICRRGEGERTRLLRYEAQLAAREYARPPLVVHRNVSNWLRKSLTATECADRLFEVLVRIWTMEKEAESVCKSGGIGREYNEAV